MEALRSAVKYVLSFRKTDWKLEDYPVRVVRQEPSSDGGPTPAWRAQIIGWWLAGLGDSPSHALEELRAALENQRANGALPRPGTTVPVHFASGEELARHGEFAYDFVEAVLGVRPFFMSDQTSLADFCTPDEIGELHRRIALLYGTDTRGMEDQPLWKVLDAVGRSGAAA